MATINSVPKSIHLPLTTNISSAPRVLMCSASVGTEASVTLQLRDVNSNDSIQSNQSLSEAAAAAATIVTSSTNTHHTAGAGATVPTTTTTTLDNALTIGYPDPEMLADVLGTLQTASLRNTNPSSESTKQNSSKLANISDISNANFNGAIKNRITISKRSSNIINNISPNTSSNNNNINSNNNSNNNCVQNISKTTTTSAVQTVSTSTNTSTAVNKTNSYIKNCLIRSSSCSNTTNITSLAQIMSNSTNNSTINNGHNNSNNNSNQLINSTVNCNSINNNNSNNNNSNSNNSLSQLNNGHTNSSSNNNSCNSNFSSSSNDSCFSYSSNSSSGHSVARSVTSLSHGSRKVPGPLTTNPPKILKKNRSKISSPSRHGPQQCQICNKIFGNASALAKHKLTHSDERKYVCVMCSKAFKRQDHLNGHMMTHRNKKPYECKAEGCGKSYCDARSLRRHTENHHAGIITPHNHQLTISNNNNNSNSNLSLSPATANGDASSPDGATCLGTYLSNGGTVVDAATGLALTEEELKALNVPLKTGVTLLSPTSTTSSMSSSSSMSNGTGATITLTDNSGGLEGEGLTREQLDLISKIMRQTKQTTAQVTVSSPTSSQSYKIDTNLQTATQSQAQNCRPRTWNMQLLNSSQNVAITVDEINADNNVNDSANKSTSINKEEEIDIDLSNAINNANLFNLVKIDQKPVECNLCHRKFKNVPALNGHMRLHGGYFKKDPETKKNEKKENSGPPLQTASIGVRALIEEKIISKRSKDLNKGAFVVPAPPSNSNQNNTTTIRRSVGDLDSFLNPKPQANSATNTTTNQQNSIQQQQQQQHQLPTVTTIKSNTKSNTNVQDINLPQSIEIYSSKQQLQLQHQHHHQQQQQQKTMNNIGVGTNVASLNAERSATKTTTSTAATINTTTTRSTSTDPKDSTLIELLKRGTRIAVTQKPPNNNTPLGGVTRQIITNKNNCSVIIPSEVQVVSTKGKLKKDDNLSNATNVTLPDGTPLSLTISQGTDSNSEVYTVTYTSDGSALFGENEVYNVNEAEMLLQTVDTMQLLGGGGTNLKSEHSEHFDIMDSKLKLEIEQQNSVDQQHQQALQQNSNQCQTTQTLPNFQHFHSKELIIQNPALISHQQIRSNNLSLPQDIKNQFASSLNSPIHSPLAYPTPPSSHENVTQTSPYIEDNHHFNDTQNIFFNESLTSASSSGENENHKILKLKNVLEDNSFDSNIRVEDLLNGTDADAECDLREFAESSLSFLDEDQEFLNDSRNATSPLSESFFTSGIGTAEEVKEVLREVLTEDQLNLNCDNQGENIIDLYYLPGLSLQSQMMPNSEDPLLSSSPRDFGQQQKMQNPMQVQQQPSVSQQAQQQQQQQHQQQQEQIQHIPQQQQQQHHIQFSNPQQQPHQIQPQHTQPVKMSVDANTQSTSATSAEINQLILNLPIIQNSVNAASLETSSTPNAATIHYNVQTVPQVQNQSNNIQHQQQQHQLQTQFLTSANISSLNEALMQPIIYTSGTTDKMELKLDNNPNSNNPQIQNIISLNKPIEILKTTNPSASNHIIFSQQQTNASISNASTNSLQPLSNQTNSILKRRLKGHSFLDNSSTNSYSKYQVLSPYKSKLRKPSRTHFTPAPILNPERKGYGLYCNVLKQLGCSLLTFESFDDDFDDSVGLVDFSDESKVNLGSAYQAAIPAFIENGCPSSFAEKTIGCDLMWDPDVQKDEKILMRFIDLSKSSAVPLGSHSEEVALQALLKAQGNTATAVLSLLQTQSNSFQIKWSAPELEIFLKGLEKHGKEFSQIARELGSKTTGECVQMYYFWKKLCVDYKVTHLKTETPVQNHANDPKPYVCEIPDCSASFSSKAALHGHTRIHTYGRNAHNNQHSSNHATATATNSNANNSQGSVNHSNTHPMHNNSQSSNNNPTNPNQKDNNTNKDNIEFPCKVCGKVFNKIKSRSAHMKTHRATDNETTVQTTNNQNHVIQQQQQQQQQQQLTQQL